MARTRAVAQRQLSLAHLSLIAGLVGGLTWSCNDNQQISTSSVGLGAGGNAKKNAKTSTSGSTTAASETNAGGSGDLGKELSTDANAEVPSAAPSGSLGSTMPGATTGDTPAIVYPTLDFSGTGVTTCDGKYYPTTASFTSGLDAVKLNLNLYNAHISADNSKVESKANDQIQGSIGPMTWARVSAQEKADLVSKGFNYAAFAIFAKSAVKTNQGQTFNFDKPLPVFPWPAPASRYDDLVKSGPQTWTANVTGAVNSPVSVLIEEVAAAGDQVTLKFTTTIQNDTDRSMYAIFPIPREATFIVNSATRDVREITQLNWFLGQQNCNGHEEQVTMVYKLCTKTTNGQAQHFPCQ